MVNFRLTFTDWDDNGVLYSSEHDQMSHDELNLIEQGNIMVDQLLNGITYVYESEGYWDKEKQQARNHRQCIGKLDAETVEFVRSKRLNQSAPVNNQPGPIPSTSSKRRFYGAIYLFDAIGEKLSITEDLKRCFPDIHINRFCLLRII